MKYGALIVFLFAALSFGAGTTSAGKPCLTADIPFTYTVPGSPGIHPAGELRACDAGELIEFRAGTNSLGILPGCVTKQPRHAEESSYFLFHTDRIAPPILIGFQTVRQGEAVNYALGGIGVCQARLALFNEPGPSATGRPEVDQLAGRHRDSSDDPASTDSSMNELERRIRRLEVLAGIR